MDFVNKIKKDLKKNLSDYRYCHSLRVADEAKKLALVYGVDSDKAYVAGLVHDIAKEFSEEENLVWIKKYNLDEKMLYSEFRRTIHSEIGALVVRELYNLDLDIVLAVKYHTVGNINMDLLAKIVFVADKIESSKDYPGILEERILAYKDIDKALFLCLDNQRKKKELECKKVHPDSLEILNYLCCKNSK